MASTTGVGIRFGIDVLLANECRPFIGKRVGAIVNQASVDANFCHLATALERSPQVSLAALFGPEHGIFGEAQYMAPVPDAPIGKRRGVPTYSLYGSAEASLAPSVEQLSSLDVLVCDLQDIGSRYYTYVATMGLALEAACRAGIAFWVLDRPNPIGLARTEGNLVSPGFESFVGRYRLPNRHGMTAGEIARMINEAIGAELTVVPCEGLRRDSSWPSERAFIAPSPNMPSLQTALVYPGLCLLEGTNVSEGRGTCQPFEQFGAPFLDADEVSTGLNALHLPGVQFRPCHFRPTFDKWVDETCNGAFLHVVDPVAFEPVRTGLAVVHLCRLLGGDQFGWRTDAYEFVEGIPAFDLLCGTDAVRKDMERGVSVDVTVAGFASAQREFAATRDRVALYG